jgi:alkanesulfonate monooxygenase SsuD/methylene tetrahydromethanopterin reductase-like flavin-dependent oxidoreductase (luciferase family)
MIALSLQIEGQQGLTWPRWKRLVEEVEKLGFPGLFRSDHFTSAQPPDKASLEMVVSLTYLADHTQRIHFGPLVAPLSVRNPTLLARQAAALDDLSEGRMILGVGAGWQEREHQLFGHELGDVPTRMARLEEGLEIITRLLGSDEPITYEGRFFHLRGATLLPHPQRPAGPRILIGGNSPKHTLPLVADYAAIWNAVFLTPDAFREHSAILDGLLRAGGRKPGEVKRTMMQSLFFGRDMGELDQRLNWRHHDPELAGKPLEIVIEILHASQGFIVGTPEVVVEELMLQWSDMDDMEGLQAFATRVLPHVMDFDYQNG